MFRCLCPGRCTVASTSRLPNSLAGSWLSHQSSLMGSGTSRGFSSRQNVEKFDFESLEGNSMGPHHSASTRSLRKGGGRQSWSATTKSETGSQRLTQILRNASDGSKAERSRRPRHVIRAKKGDWRGSKEAKKHDEDRQDEKRGTAKATLIDTLRAVDELKQGPSETKAIRLSETDNKLMRRLQDQRKAWSWNVDQEREGSSHDKAAKYLFSDLEIPADQRKKPDTSSSNKSDQSERSATTLYTGQEAAERKRVEQRRQSVSTDSGLSQSFYVPAEQSLSSEERWLTTVGGKFSASDVVIQEVTPLREMEVPELAHGLDRVLFNPGVYWLRDPRSGIYNFDPQIRNLHDVDLFDYSALPPYQTSSMDDELAALTRKHQKRYSGSTSSLTGLLSHIYFFISAWKSPNLTGFTEGFDKMPKGFAFGAKLPANIYLRRFEEPSEVEPGKSWVRYAIDNDKSAGGEADNSNYVLTQLGKSVEKLLTSNPEEYERYLRVNSHQITEEERNKKEAYYYSASDKFMMRSQLDCSDDRLPRRTFDLKTRAVVAVRMDRANWVESSGYTLRTNTGVNESFERELWDMSRGTLLKYFFQARIGNMDGILVAYHSTSSMFGFQYLSREDLATRLFGSEEMGEQAYRLAIGMLENILDQVTTLFPDKTLRITVDAQANEVRRNPNLNVFVRGEKDADVLAEHNGQPRQSFMFKGTVDRYLSDALVEGPVDFNQPEGHRVDLSREDEIRRRQRKNLPPLVWNLEWSLAPCADMDDNETNKSINKVLQRQRNVSAMQLPNIEALNERERSRQEALRVNPEAWQRFVQDRKSGRAAGMPLAPGQVSLEERLSSEEVSWQDMGEAEGGDGKSSARMLRTSSNAAQDEAAYLQQEQQQDEALDQATDDVTDEEVRATPPHLSTNKVKWIPSTTQINRLRQLAQLGQQDKDEREKTDQLQMYERRGD